jgi:hypothetical protein
MVTSQRDQDRKFALFVRLSAISWFGLVLATTRVDSYVGGGIQREFYGINGFNY